MNEILYCCCIYIINKIWTKILILVNNGTLHWILPLLSKTKIKKKKRRRIALTCQQITFRSWWITSQSLLQTLACLLDFLVRIHSLRKKGSAHPHLKDVVRRTPSIIHLLRLSRQTVRYPIASQWLLRKALCSTTIWVVKRGWMELLVCMILETLNQIWMIRVVVLTLQGGRRTHHRCLITSKRRYSSHIQWLVILRNRVEAPHQQAIMASRSQSILIRELGSEVVTRNSSRTMEKLQPSWQDNSKGVRHMKRTLTCLVIIHMNCRSHGCSKRTPRSTTSAQS